MSTLWSLNQVSHNSEGLDANSYFIFNTNAREEKLYHFCETLRHATYFVFVDRQRNLPIVQIQPLKMRDRSESLQLTCEWRAVCWDKYDAKYQVISCRLYDDSTTKPHNCAYYFRVHLKITYKVLPTIIVLYFLLNKLLTIFNQKNVTTVPLIGYGEVLIFRKNYLFISLGVYLTNQFQAF